MKKSLLVAIGVVFTLSSYAQTELEEQKKKLKEAQAEKDKIEAQIKAIKGNIQALTPPVIWKKGGFGSVNFNQVGLNNWAAGGVQSISLTTIGNLYANYKKDNVRWDNNLDLAYGVVQNEGENLRKNEDKIDFSTKLGIKAAKNLDYAAMVNFKSQFAPGFDFGNESEDRPMISRFMAPAFILASLGFDYRPTDYLSLYISPATGKFTVVNDDSIAAMHLYIPESAPNANFRAEFGALATAIFEKKLSENIKLRSRLDLFNNFTDPNKTNRENIDVNWETNFNMKLGKYIGLSLFTHVIYDDDIDVPLEFNNEGETVKAGPRLQFKEVFGIGFSYQF
jgi:hypothetical protein